MYYTYVTTDFNRYYIGSKTGEHPEEDGYMGSYTDEFFVPTHKFVVSKHKSRVIAAFQEWGLQTAWNSSFDDRFVNQQRATIMCYTDEARQHMSKVISDMNKEKRTEEWNKKISKANTGKKMSALARRNMSKPRQSFNHKQNLNSRGLATAITTVNLLTGEIKTRSRSDFPSGSIYKNILYYESVSTATHDTLLACNLDTKRDFLEKVVIKTRNGKHTDHWETYLNTVDKIVASF